MTINLKWRMQIVDFFSELIEFSNTKFIQRFCWNGKLWLRPTYSSGYWLLCTVHDKRCQRQRSIQICAYNKFYLLNMKHCVYKFDAVVFVFRIQCSLYDIFYGFPLTKRQPTYTMAIPDYVSKCFPFIVLRSSFLGYNTYANFLFFFWILLWEGLFELYRIH